MSLVRPKHYLLGQYFVVEHKNVFRREYIRNIVLKWTLFRKKYFKLNFPTGKQKSWIWNIRKLSFRIILHLLTARIFKNQRQMMIFFEFKKSFRWVHMKNNWSKKNIFCFWPRIRNKKFFQLFYLCTSKVTILSYMIFWFPDDL